jgi:hypothetical protein
MAKPNSKAEAMAREAAARIDADRAAGKQLTFLPDEPQPGESGRAVRGKGKAASQLRDWLAARGMRLPEDQLAAMAGLATSDDVFTHAMATAERVLIWAQEGATGYKGAPIAPSMGQRLETFKFVYTAALRAAEALLPYGLAKVTPDVAAQPAVQVVVMPAGQAASGAQPGPQSARDVTPQARKLAPPPMPWEMQQNQQVADANVSQSGLSDRTEGPKC